jgi:hypothetical protein
MDKDLQIELLTGNYVKLEEKFDRQQLQIKSLEERLEEFEKLLIKNSQKSPRSPRNSESSNSESSNHLSITFNTYKKSVLVTNLYKDKNGTQNFKDEFKKLDAKWFSNKELDIKGWLFVGKLKGTLEESAKPIIEHFEKICTLEYNLND